MPDWNRKLKVARREKNDEFYTRYVDVEKEMGAYAAYDPDVFRGRTVLLPCDDPDLSGFTRYFADNFDALGLRRLVSTSYEAGGRGKIYVLERNGGGLRGRLAGDGDFRSDEVTRLRDEADIVATNPPFSLFREFLPWLLDAGKRFSILGNVNAIGYRDVFPLIQNHRIWLGASIHGGARLFDIPDTYPLDADCCGIDDKGRRFIRVKGIRWYTNMEHGRTPPPLHLDTMERNLRSNRHLRAKLEREYGALEYPRYDECDAIEVPYVDAIPSDYDGLMGVPITFLDKHNPDQFEIVGFGKGAPTKALTITTRDGKIHRPYSRLLIRRHRNA